MKKYLVALLALVMMFALAVPVFAAEDPITSLPGSSSAEIKAEYEAGTEDKNVATVYHVTVDWTINSTLKYSDGKTTYTWNAEDTVYVGTTENKGWTGNATVTIKVTNKSNADITATPSWEAAAPIEADCSFASASIDIDSAAKDVDIADGEAGEAKIGEITATVDAPTEGTINASDAVVGTITLSIVAK